MFPRTSPPPPTILFLLVLYLFAYSASGVQGEISTGNLSIVEASSDLVISCSFELYDGQDISWFFNNIEINLADHRVNVTATDFSSTLIISEATFADSGLYLCKLLELEEYFSTQITVGTSPDKPGNLNCFTRNTIEITCTWLNVEETNLDVTYIFEYAKYKSSDSETWYECPELQDNLCYIDTFRPDVYVKSGYFDMRVTATNALGSKETSIIFEPNDEVKTYPPNNLIVEAISNSEIQLKYSKPDDSELLFFLVYKVEYFTEWSPDKVMELPETGELDYLVSNLEFYTNYTFHISCKKNIIWSDWSDPVSAKSMEAKPSGQVDILSTIQMDGSKNDLQNVSIFWVPLEERDKNGQILYNIMSAIPIENPMEDNFSVNIEPSLTDYTFIDLQKYISYTLEIFSCNSVGCSLGSSSTIHPLSPLSEDATTTTEKTALAIGITIGVAFALIVVIFLAIYYPIILEKIGAEKYFTIAEPHLPSLVVSKENHHYVNNTPTWLGDEEFVTKSKYVEIFDPLYAKGTDLKKSSQDDEKAFKTTGQAQQQIPIGETSKEGHQYTSDLLIKTQISMPDDVFLENDKVAEIMDDTEGNVSSQVSKGSNQKQMPAESNSSNDSYGYQRVGKNGNLIPIIPSDDKKGEAAVTEKEDIRDSEVELAPNINIMSLSEQVTPSSESRDYVSKDHLPSVIKQLPKNYSLLSHPDAYFSVSPGSCSSEVISGSVSSGYVTHDNLSTGQSSYDSDLESGSNSSPDYSPTRKPFQTTYSPTAIILPPDPDSIHSKTREPSTSVKIDSHVLSVEPTHDCLSSYISLENLGHPLHKSSISPISPNTLQNSDDYIAISQLPQKNNVANDSASDV